MRHLISFSESISYEWTSVENKKFQKDSHFEYFFSDEYDNQFKVQIERKSPWSDTVELVYLVKNIHEDEDEDDFRGGWSYDLIKTNIYRVLQTVFGDILTNFLKENNWCDRVELVGILKKSENTGDVSKRSKIYKRFLDKNPIPGFAVNQDINLIVLSKII